MKGKNMEFKADSQEAKEVPFFKDTTSKGGWAGHTTDKSIDKLQFEVKEAISLLGGTVTGFMKGTFSGKNPRDGYRVHYIMQSPNGMVQGKMEIAALPIEKKPWMSLAQKKAKERKREQALKMALFLLRDSLKGMWYLQQLSPGFAALMPFMIVNDAGETITQLWSRQAEFTNLLPSGESEFEADILEGDYTEVKE